MLEPPSSTAKIPTSPAIFFYRWPSENNTNLAYIAPERAVCATDHGLAADPCATSQPYISALCFRTSEAELNPTLGVFIGKHLACEQLVGPDQTEKRQATGLDDFKVKRAVNHPPPVRKF